MLLCHPNCSNPAHVSCFYLVVHGLKKECRNPISKKIKRINYDTRKTEQKAF